MKPDLLHENGQAWDDWLLACDEALAHGEPLPLSPCDDDLAPPPLPLQRQLSCIRLLRELLTPLPQSPRFATLDLHAARPPLRLGRFEIVAELGRGGFGIVYLARDSLLGRSVALKVPRPETLADLNLRQRFLREAQLAAKLDHPNLVAVHEAGAAGPMCYIASAYCPGQNLADWLRCHPEPVDARAAAAFLAALADGVQHAHDHGILHRDLKPSNILLAAAADAEHDSFELFQPMLTDFGLAKFHDAQVEETRSGVLAGTPGYMAPEQAEGDRDRIGPATDVYALGVILYETLTRKLPFRGGSLLLTLEKVLAEEPAPLLSLRPDLPRDLQTICLKCLSKEPAERYAAARDLADDLRRFLRDEPIRARPLGWWDRCRRWCRKPARIHDASVIAMLNAFVATGGTLAGTVSLLLGLVQFDQPVATLVFQLVIIVGDVLPLAWIAVRARAHRLSALWAGILVPVLFMAFLSSVVFGSVDVGMVNENDMRMRMSAYSTVAFLNLVQIACFVPALIAYYANRRRPGFIPAS